MSLDNGDAREDGVVLVLMFRSVWGRRRVQRRALSADDDGGEDENEGEGMAVDGGPGWEASFLSGSDPI